MTYTRIRPLVTRLVLGLSGLPIVLFVMACGGTSLPSPDTATAALIGQWRQTSIGVDGDIRQCPTSLATPGGGTIACGANDTVEFKEDGSFSATVSGLAVKVLGKWRLDGSTLQVTFTEPPEVAGTTTSAVVQHDQGSDTLRINPSGATPTAAIYVRQ